MLGYGNIRIVTASGEAGVDNLTSIRDVDAFQREILEQKTAGAGVCHPVSERRPAAPAAAVHRSRRRRPRSRRRSASWLGCATPGAITVEEFEAKKAELLARI